MASFICSLSSAWVIKLVYCCYAPHDTMPCMDLLTVLLVVLVVLVAGCLGLVDVLWRKLAEPAAPLPPADTQPFTFMQNQIEQLTRAVDSKLLEVIRGVSQTQESTKQVFTIAEQLNNLEKVLKNQ